MKVISLFITALICNFCCRAFGDSIPLNKNVSNLSFEAGGNGLIYSFKFERVLFSKKMPKVSASIGVIYSPFRIIGIFDYKSFGILGEGTLLLGKKRDYFEVGAGMSHFFLYDNYLQEYFENTSLTIIIPRLGYRHYLRNNRSFFKFSYTPLIVLFNNPEDPWDPPIFPLFAGISYGVVLNSKKD